jgi:gp16 family phage-associated protein
VAQIPQKIEVGKEPLTIEEVRDWFAYHGQTVTGWAAQHGFQPAQVYAVLSARTRGRRGESHQIAVALGLKRGAIANN